MLIKLADAEARYSVHRDTLLRWIKRGLITGYKTPTGHWRVAQPELDALFGVSTLADSPALETPQEAGERG